MISQMDLRFIYIYINLYIFFFGLHFNYFSLIFNAIIFRLNLIIFSINFRYLKKCIDGKRKYYYNIYYICESLNTENS